MMRPSQVRTPPRQVVSRYGDLVAQMYDHHIEVREKGRRETLTVTWDQIWAVGSKNAAAAKRAERAAAKESGRGRK